MDNFGGFTMVAIITVVAVAVIIIDYAEMCPRNLNSDHTQTFQTICARLCLFMTKFDIQAYFSKFSYSDLQRN